MRRLFLCVGLALALASTPLPTRAADPFEINAILSLTGSGSFVGKAEATALGILETTVNADGGIAGRRVKFAIADDQSSPQVAVQLANAILAKGATAIVGPTLVAPCQAIAPLVKGKAVELCLSSGFHPDHGSFAYTSGVSTLDQLVVALRYLRQAGYRKIATLTSLDVNGQDADHGIEQALSRPENRELSLAAALHFNLTDLTVTAQMARIKESGAQVLVNYNTGTPFGTVLHGYTDVGLDIPIVTQPASLNYAVMRQFASLLPKQLLITGLVGDAPEVAPRGAVAAAVATYGKALKAVGVMPDHVTALAWDPALIVVSGYRKLGTDTSGSRLNDFIQNLHGWAGMNGEYDFRVSQSGLTTASLVIVRWDPDKEAFAAVSKPGGIPLTSNN